MIWLDSQRDSNNGEFLYCTLLWQSCRYEINQTAVRWETLAQRPVPASNEEGGWGRKNKAERRESSTLAISVARGNLH
jgi:hypothetical protein